MARIFYTQRDIEHAKEMCVHYHQGQVRKGNNEPFHTHPFEVVKILEKYSYDDPVTLMIGYLHDTIEDSPLRMDEVQDAFGYEISNGVYILSRNKGKMIDHKILNHNEYIQRLHWARKKIKRVKIADMIHNTRDLHNLSPRGIEKKINDATNYYIPWGKEISPLMVKELETNIKNYLGCLSLSK